MSGRLCRLSPYLASPHQPAVLIADRAAFRKAREATKVGDAGRLLTLLGTDREKALVVHVLRGLEKARDARVAPELFRYVEIDRRPAVQNRLVKTLATLAGSDAFPVLREALVRDGEPCRYGAVEGLVRIGGDEAVEVLQHGIHDPDRDLRANIAIGLGDIGGDPAVALLAKMLNDPDRAVRTRAYRALVRIGTPASIHVLEELSRRVQSRLWRLWIKRRARKLASAAESRT